MLKRTGSRRGIVYLQTQEDCLNFIKIFTVIGSLVHGILTWGKCIIATTNSSKRQTILEEFESGDGTIFKILTSCGCLDQAVDLIKCDSVFITSVGTNQIRTTQRICRGIRRDDQNPFKINNVLLWTDGSDIKCLDMLREHDPEFHQKIRCIDRHYDKQNTVERLQDVESSSNLFYKLVNISCLSLEDIWNNNFKLLEEYCKKNNKLPPLSNPDIGEWLNSQKTAYTNNTILEERKKKMISIPQFLEWTNEDKKEVRSFDESFKLLEEYCKKNNKLPPRSIPDIGVWLYNQKIAYNNKMTEERKKKMISIPQFLEWTKEDKKEFRPFDESFKLLEEYSKKNNKLPPRSNPDIGSWLHDQKTAYNNKMPEERKKKMISIPQFLEWTKEDKKRI